MASFSLELQPNTQESLMMAPHAPDTKRGNQAPSTYLPNDRLVLDEKAADFLLAAQIFLTIVSAFSSSYSSTH